MPIHFGYATSGTQKPSSSLRARGLNLVRASPSQVKISFVPDAFVLAFFLVVATLANFLASLAKRTVVPNGECTRIPLLPHLVPFRLPPLAIRITDNNPAIVALFLESGFESQVIRQRTLLLKDRPTMQDFQTVMTNPSIDRKCFTPYKYVNTEGMMTFLTLRKIATLFLGLDLISAFNDSTRTLASFIGKTSTPKTPVAPSAEASTSKPITITSKYSWNWRRATGSNQLRSDPQAFAIAEDMCVLDYRNYGPLHLVVKALEDGGVYAPYVPELSRDDDSGPVSFVKTYAFSCLGSTRKQCFDELEQLRRGWGLLSKTNSGHQLAHFFRCAELSLNGQCGFRCIITETGRYDGCVMIGTGFDILTNGIVSRPLSSEALRHEIMEYGSHDTAVRNISAAITTAESAEGFAASFPTSMTQLRSVILTSSLDEDDKNVIRRWAPHLDYESDQWGINPTTLEKFLNVAHTGLLPSDTPITVQALFEPNAALAALSAFGYTSCPSFRIENGRKLDLRGPMPPPKMETQMMKGKKRTADVLVDDFDQTIQVQQVPYRIACADLTEMLIDGHIRVIPVGNTNENIRVYRGAQRGLLWNALSKVVHNHNADGASGGDSVTAVGNEGLTAAGVIRKEDTEREIDAYL